MCVCEAWKAAEAWNGGARGRRKKLSQPTTRSSLVGGVNGRP